MLFATTLLCAEAAVTDWEFEKGAFYSQISDNTVPPSEDGWFVSIDVETGSASDATAVSISRSVLAGNTPLEQNDGEWCLFKIYETESEANTEFPNNTSYTITLSGGTLGTLVQQVTLGPPNYPSVPYLTNEDASRARSINTAAPFMLQWGPTSAPTNFVSAEINDKISDIDVWDQETTIGSTSGTIPAGTLTPGHCYELKLANLNEVIIDGAGGFGVEGYLLQTRVLLRDIFTVYSPHVSPIDGAWQRGEGVANNSVILVFLADGTYFHAEDGSDEAEAPDGIERGTYVWDEDSGILTITPEVDTNGEFGGSHPEGDFTATASDSILTVGDQAESSVFQRVSGSPNTIVGGWRICINTASTPGVLVFLENGV
ncbi:MAG: hypothetical protein GWQ05_04175 [Verrucomicrobiaceae bacterium]|nr:hypothetical protein [Verrucomicrobiaceae bacterium]NCF90143.1 hypothetical protein [Verrucomicrobiaceae bacterium]